MWELSDPFLSISDFQLKRKKLFSQLNLTDIEFQSHNFETTKWIALYILFTLFMFIYNKTQYLSLNSVACMVTVSLLFFLERREKIFRKREGRRKSKKMIQTQKLKTIKISSVNMKHISEHVYFHYTLQKIKNTLNRVFDLILRNSDSYRGSILVSNSIDF